MDLYLLARLGHVAGFILLGGGLAAVFLADWRGRRATDARAFAEAARFTALFYDGLVVPGTIMIAVSGLTFIYTLGLGFFEAPWLVGMWGLFAFEFVEGNTITRLVYRRTLRRAQAAAAGSTDTEFASQSLIGRLTHFLDLPLFAVIVYCGVARPDSWMTVGVGIAIAVSIALALTFTAPQRRSGSNFSGTSFVP